MQYKDMKEMTITEWDGKPFMAFFTDNEYDEVTRAPIATISGFHNGDWLTEYGIHWSHAYPVELNQPKTKRMTNRQLSLWVAKGNGEWKPDGGNYVMTHYTYLADQANLPVGDTVKVRTCDSEEWVEPTINLLEKEA